MGSRSNADVDSSELVSQARLLPKGGEQYAPILLRKSPFGLAVPIMATLPLPIVTACEANSPLKLSRVKRQARLVLVTVDKHPNVLDPASEPALMNTKLDISFSSGVLAISPTKRKHGHLVGSKNKPPKDTGLRKLAPSGKRCVPKPVSASRKLQLQLVVPGDGAEDAPPVYGLLCLTE